MKYLQLNVRKLPDNAGSSVVFPYLQVESKNENVGGSNVLVSTYRFAVLASDENELLQLGLLEKMGFEKIESLPASEGLEGAWSFYVCTDTTVPPFKPLTDRPGEPPETKLATYLNIEFEGVDEDFRKPKTISIVKGSLHESLFNKDAKFGYSQLSLSKDDSRWGFTWGTDGDENNIQVAFTIPLDIVSIAPFDLSSREASHKLCNVSLVPLANVQDNPWSGCEFKLSNTVVDGKVGDTLALDNLSFVSSSPQDFAFELPQEAIGLKINTSTTINLRSSLLLARYSASGNAEIKLQSNGEGQDLTIEASFPLIMAPTSGLPNALSLIVPLVSDTTKVLSFHFQIHLGEGFDWDQNLLKLDTDGQRWNFSNNLWIAAEQKSWDISTRWQDENSTGLGLGGFDWSLADLLGEAVGVDFKIRPFRNTVQENVEDSAMVPSRIHSGAIVIPVLLELSADNNKLNLCLDLMIDPSTFRLSTNRLYFRLPAASNCESIPIIDLKAFAIILPVRPAARYLEASSTDGYFDFAERELVIFASSDRSVEKPVVTIPGNLRERDFSQRLLFEFQDFHPDSWPLQSPTKRPIFLRINGEGLTLYARVMTAHSPNVLKQGDNRRALGLTPLAERNGKASEIVIINNTIRKAVLYGEFEVPGVDDLLAKVEIGMRQDKRGQPPVIHAEVDLDTTNGKPLANFSSGYLQIQIDDMRARLEWNLDNDAWDLSVPVDASFMLANEISKTGGLDDLRNPDVIKVRDLDLIRIHEGFGEITLPLPDAVNFTCLGGMFAVSLKKLRFGWGKTFYLECDEAEFAYLDPGTLQVAIEVGGVYLEFSGGGQVKMRNPDRIGIDVTIGDNVRFRGAVAWVDNDRENYFAAAGTLAIEGMPEAKTVLKIGTGTKQNGQIVPNITLYGSMDYEVTLFSGVVAKNFGAGIGINNRLTGIDDRPNAEKLLANIDRIDPSNISGWQFVERNGFYLSIVGTTIIASNPGGNSVNNAYVAALLLSIDVDLNIVAAGKVWLASSVDYVRKRENWSRPALVGAIAILPRDQLFTAAIESRQNPAIESSEQLSTILNKGHIKMSFLLSPDLVDFFLQEVSYRESFLGVDMLYQGSFRLAVLSGTTLVRANQMITGHFSKTLEAGAGGFSCRGDIAVGVEFGGLLSRDGLAAYGMIAVQVLLDVDAWITIGFSTTIGWGRWKKRLSFNKTFRLDSTRLEIGLYGVVAFNERGEFGFAGELSISISVCGYRLSVAPSLKIREEVIVSVRRRVAVFENNLEAYRHKLLADDTTSLVSLEEDSTSAPTWLHYQIGEWHLLVPQSDATWFTPFATEPSPGSQIPFSGHVVSINIGFGLRMMSVSNDEEQQKIIKEFHSEFESKEKEKECEVLIVHSTSFPDEWTIVGFNKGEFKRLLINETSSELLVELKKEPANKSKIFEMVSSKLDFTHTITLRMPWHRDFWNDPVSDETGSQPLSPTIKDALEELEATMAETTVSDKDKKPTSRPLNEYEIITDPRVESPNREFWLDIDQALLPDHALPVRMKSADQILQSGEAPQDFNSTYGRLVNFLFWSQRAIIERRHSGNDLSLEKDLEQRRAVVLFEIMRELKNVALSEDGQEIEEIKSPWLATEDNKFRGLIFKLSQAEARSIDKITVTRHDESAIDQRKSEDVVIQDVKQKLEEARQSVRLHPPRQEYVVDVEAGENGVEEGRVLVRLPIGYDKKFFNEYLPVFSHFEVWRRIRGQGKPVRVGSYQLPSLTYLDNNPEEKPVVVVEPYIFSDNFCVRGKVGERLFDLGVLADKTLIDYAIKFVPIDDQADDEMAGLSPWQSVKLHVPAPDTFPIDLSLVFDVRSLYQPQPNDLTTTDSLWTHFQLASMGDERVTLALTDEWERIMKAKESEESEADHQPRRFQIWAEERPIVDSGFYAGSADEARRSLAGDADPNLGAISAEQPVLSLSDKFLVAVEPVAKKPGTWQFSKVQLFIRDGYAYRFYIRPIYQGESGDRAEGVLRSLTLAISKNIPFVANKAELTGKGVLDDQLGAFVSSPETHCWFEDRKEVEPAAPGLRTVRQIEWIHQAEVDLLHDLCLSDTNKTPQESIVPVSASVRSLERNYPAAKRRRRIGISWNHPGRTRGGVEIQIRDRDDAAVAARFVCETREYTAYQHSIRDFSNDSAWRLTRRENAQRLTIPPVVTVNESEPVGGAEPNKAVEQIINQTLFLDKGNPLLQLLNLRASQLSTAIVVKESSKDWGMVATVASQMMEAIGNFENSQLNINDEPLQKVITQIEALIRYLFLGMKSQDSLLTLTPEQIESIDSALRNTLLDIDDLNPEATDFENSAAGAINAQRAFLDADYARKLASIIRRRLNIGEDVLATVGEGLPLAAVESNQNDNWLPRGAVFESIRNKQAEADKKFGVGGSLPNVSKLLKWFPETTTIPTWSSSLLKNAIAELLLLIEYNKKVKKVINEIEVEEEVPDDSRRKTAASIVAKAAGLTIGLQRLERQFETDGWRLERRPHHRVTVAENNIGAKVPELVEMKVLLPDTHRSLDDEGGKTSAGSSSEPNLIAYFNLLERMGFALDLGGTDETGEPLPQVDLVAAIRKANLEMLFKDKQGDIDEHYVYLVMPREPDSEYRGDFPDPEPGLKHDNAYFYAGLSFVKLIIVPKLFHDLLVSHHTQSITNPESVNDILKNWFEIRGVILDNNANNAIRQVQLFASAAHFASCQKIGDETKPVVLGNLLPLRLMPLELHYLTVPHINGFAHVDWETPDRRGHRFEVSARSMSRYEPLLRWAHDLPRPEVTHAGAELDTRRIITSDDGVDLPIPLSVSNFPHPELLRFSYTLPPAGIRSLLNRISAIRTGYRGCQLTFQYNLVDHDDPENRGWEKIVKEIVVDTSTEEIKYFSPVIVPTPRSCTAEVRLFRHERLITLAEIPYFYAVQLSVNGQFEGDLEGASPRHDPMTESVFARRMPVVIAYRPPVVPKLNPVTGEYEIKVVLTRLGEMASPAELAGGIPLLSSEREFKDGKKLSKDGKKLSFPDDVLPMPSLGYHFYYRVKDNSGNSDANSDSVYRSVIDLLMPWHEGYKANDANGAKPYVRSFDSDVIVNPVNAYPEIRLCKITGTEELVPVVTVKFKVTTDDLFSEPSRRYIQVSCYGKLTAATLLRENS